MPGKSILFISSMKGDPWGGSEEFWFRIALHLAANGYQVHCACFDWPQGKEEKIKQLRSTGCTITLLSNKNCAHGLIDKIRRKAKAKQQLRQLLQGKFDLVCISQGGFEDVIHQPFSGLLPMLKKFVLVNHNYNEERLLNDRRKARLHRWTHAAALNMADAARVFTAMEKVTSFVVPNQYVIVNPVTVALQDGEAAWPALNENGNYRWCMMAQLDTSRKAQDVLIKALAGDRWKNRNWELYLYGKGEDQQGLEQLIAAAGMEHRIHLMGHTSQVAEVLAQSHLLLQITHIDAMPLSVTEAMSMARPCIVSSTGDMPLWIKDGSNGFIAAEVTVQGIDDVLERAWMKQENWQQMGKAAFDVFLQKYPRPYEAFYEKVFLGLMQ